MVSNDAMVDLYAANAEILGREVRDPAAVGGVVGSTDMGNVSYEVPSIHPMIQAADAGVAIHTEAFAEFAAGPQGDRAVLDGAKAMAWTMADLWLARRCSGRRRRRAPPQGRGPAMSAPSVARSVVTGSAPPSP
jgi:metal-dependent amidase/aminoacylase/carboxypeptidase family protein